MVNWNLWENTISPGYDKLKSKMRKYIFLPDNGKFEISDKIKFHLIMVNWNLRRENTFFTR